MRKTGYYETLGKIDHFIPDPLPPQNPALNLDEEIMGLYGDAMLQLGKLNEMTSKLPEKKHFIKAYVIKEALLSSAIEGIHTTLLEVYTQPLIGSKPNKDTQLVMNYTKALDRALFMIKKEKLPITSRVILRAHEELMRLGEGDKSDPGHYRKQSVKVGNLIPASALQVQKLMSDLERYINTDESPALIKAGLAHVQFETIHPFLDGNGRIGRLLIVLILIENNILAEPILYPSYYFKKHNLEYYKSLDRVRTDGDFEGWIKFYLTAIRDSCIDAYQRAKDIETLRKNITQIILQDSKNNKMHDNLLKALTVFFNFPVISIKELSLQLDISYNTANSIIIKSLELGFIVEDTKKKRGKLFKFKKYLDILERD